MKELCLQGDLRSALADNVALFGDVSEVNLMVVSIVEVGEEW